jgi:importin-7
LREKSGKKADDGSAADDETLDSSDDDSIDEELGFETPLDSVDPYITFKRALTGKL